MRENRVMATNKKTRIPSAFYRLGLLFLFLNFPNIKHIAPLYNGSIAYLAGRKMNHEKINLHSLFKCIDDIYFAPVSKLVHNNGPFSPHVA